MEHGRLAVIAYAYNLLNVTGCHSRNVSSCSPKSSALLGWIEQSRTVQLGETFEDHLAQLPDQKLIFKARLLHCCAKFNAFCLWGRFCLGHRAVEKLPEARISALQITFIFSATFKGT